VPSINKSGHLRDEVRSVAEKKHGQCYNGRLGIGFQKKYWIEKFVYDAIAHFNYGQKATIDVFCYVNNPPGTNTTRGCTTVNRNRKRQRAY